MTTGSTAAFCSRAGWMVLLALVLTSCGRAEREREAAVEAAVEATRAATMAEIERALSQALSLTDREADRANDILSPLPVMTTAQENALRRFLNASHVARARELGVRVANRAARDSLVAARRLIQLEDSTAYWIVRPGTSPTYMVPEVPVLLEELGRRFQERLAEMGLPPYRIEVTSALRTSERQARLRGRNPNAATGVSSHEFGTTVDLSYSAFAPPAERPPEILAGIPAEFAPHVERFVDLALESVSGRKSRELGAIFSRVLLEAQSEGLVFVIYERQQTIYHITVGRALVDD